MNTLICHWQRQNTGFPFSSLFARNLILFQPCRTGKLISIFKLEKKREKNPSPKKYIKKNAEFLRFYYWCTFHIPVPAGECNCANHQTQQCVACSAMHYASCSRPTVPIAISMNFKCICNGMARIRDEKWRKGVRISRSNNEMCQCHRRWKSPYYENEITTVILQLLVDKPTTGKHWIYIKRNTQQH